MGMGIASKVVDRISKDALILDYFSFMNSFSASPREAGETIT